MSTHFPSTSYFQPWYVQRRPFSSLRPKKRSAQRWAQARSMRPTRQLVSRNARSLSPNNVTRRGEPSGSWRSDSSKNGNQNLRTSSPMGVPRPTCVSRSFSSRVSIGDSFNGLFHSTGSTEPFKEISPAKTPRREERPYLFLRTRLALRLARVILFFTCVRQIQPKLSKHAVPIFIYRTGRQQHHGIR